MAAIKDGIITGVAGAAITGLGAIGVGFFSLKSIAKFVGIPTETTHHIRSNLLRMPLRYRVHRVPSTVHSLT
jgi:hypothetical protein